MVKFFFGNQLKITVAGVDIRFALPLPPISSINKSISVNKENLSPMDLSLKNCVQKTGPDQSRNGASALPDNAPPIGKVKELWIEKFERLLNGAHRIWGPKAVIL